LTERTLVVERNSDKVKKEIKSYQEKIHSLTKELQSKDKALAETAALLMLEKKIQELFRAQHRDDV